MNKHLELSLAVAALLTLPLARAQVMSQADYQAGKTHISTDYTADKTGCASLSGNAKDICVEEAKGKEKVAYAELEYKYTGLPADQNKVMVAKAEAVYAVSKERCDDKAGNAKDVCVKEAKAMETQALADAKMGRQIGAARSEASAEKSAANYQVAFEKCEAMAGDARSACVTAAKANYGQK